MNSQGAYRVKFGFTIIEVLLSCALIMIIGMFMFPLGLNFYHTQTRMETHEILESVLRKAQQYAMMGRGASSYGVKLEEGRYILFEGSSYAERNIAEDEVYHFPLVITISGFDEIIFDIFTGRPQEETVIYIEGGGRDSTFFLNSEGILDHTS